MRVLLIGLSLLSAVLFSASIQAQELKPIMESIGSEFKATFQNAARANNDQQAQDTIASLKANIEKATKILPDGVSPNDQETVDKYLGLMGELLQQTILLQDAFATNPMNRAEAMVILKEMDALRKKGHAIFR